MGPGGLVLRPLCSSCPRAGRDGSAESTPRGTNARLAPLGGGVLGRKLQILGRISQCQPVRLGVKAEPLDSPCVQQGHLPSESLTFSYQWSWVRGRRALD